MIEPLAGLRNNKKKEKGKDDFKMKKFSLNTKRASKVLALALVAALVVPSVPAQNSSAASDGQIKYAGGETAVEVPKAIGKVTFSYKADYVKPKGTKGEKIVFTDKTVTKDFTAADGKTTYQSLDKEPKMEDGEIVREAFDTAPKILNVTSSTSVSTTDAAINAKRGHVLELKTSEKVPQYPSNAETTADAIAAGGQVKQDYYSGVEVENPFASPAERKKLYGDYASNYSFDKIVETATKVQVGDAHPEWYDDPTVNKNIYAVERRTMARASKPEVKGGVTISFWAKAPVDDDGVVPTNFFEFSNTESLVYNTNDVGKAYIAQLYADMVDAETVDATDSPFYAGELVEGTVINVNPEKSENIVPDLLKELSYQNEEALNKDVASGKVVFSTRINFGSYVRWNPVMAATDGAISLTSNSVRWWLPKTKKTNTVDGAMTIAVNEGGKVYDYCLFKSDPMYTAGSSESDLTNFMPTDEYPNGKKTRIIEGATGYLFMSPEQVQFRRDDNENFKTGIDMNENNKGSTYGTAQNGQASDYMYVKNPASSETAEDGEWHYYTVSITNEWMQVYVDGVACDPTAAESFHQDCFNMGSGMFAPNGNRIQGTKKNFKTDFEKLYNWDWVEGSYMYGQIFGEPVMSYITDENTKLIIGGKTQETAEGTLLDSFAFYDVALDAEQAAAEYAARKNEADPEPDFDPSELDVPDVTLGDVDDNGKINADDALTILKKLAKIDVPKYVEEAADVDGNGKVNADDALLILKVLAKIPGAEFKQK